MCHIKMIYPNAWQWMIQTVFEWEFKWENIVEAFDKYINYLLDKNLLWWNMKN